jgi:threonine/homoserine/homoserine lactone efflux protein
VAFQWVNPKAWLICAGAVGSFLEADAPSPLPQALFFALTFIIAGTPCMLLWLCFGTAMQRLLTTDGAFRNFNIAMGIVLAATAVMMI